MLKDVKLSNCARNALKTKISGPTKVFKFQEIRVNLSVIRFETLISELLLIKTDLYNLIYFL